MEEAIFLFSAPTQFGHSFTMKDMRIVQVAGNIGEARHFGHPGPFEHYFYALAIPALPTAKPEVNLFAINPDDALALLSLYFGKRLINHGPVSFPGLLTLADLQSVRPNPYYALPLFSSAHGKLPARDPDWSALAQIRVQLEDLVSPGCSRPALVAAASAYAESIRMLPLDREIAYFRLIQALESVASSQSLSDSDKFSADEEVLKHLTWLEAMGDPRGSAVASLIRQRLYQVRRGVWLWLRAHIDAAFYSEEGGALSPDRLEGAISAAYALRSRYAHAGERFGDWIDPTDGRCRMQETVPPEFAAVCSAKDLRKLLLRCPSYLGLERLVRYALNTALAASESGRG